MRPLDRFARALAITLPAAFAYGPDVLRYGLSALAVYDPAKALVAGLGALGAVAFHAYDCRARARAAAAERERVQAAAWGDVLTTLQASDEPSQSAQLSSQEEASEEISAGRR